MDDGACCGEPIRGRLSPSPSIIAVSSDSSSVSFSVSISVSSRSHMDLISFPSRSSLRSHLGLVYHRIIVVLGLGLVFVLGLILGLISVSSLSSSPRIISVHTTSYSLPDRCHGNGLRRLQYPEIRRVQVSLPANQLSPFKYSNKKRMLSLKK